MLVYDKDGNLLGEAPNYKIAKELQLATLTEEERLQYAGCSVENPNETFPVFYID